LIEITHSSVRVLKEMLPTIEGTLHARPSYSIDWKRGLKHGIKQGGPSIKTENIFSDLRIIPSTLPTLGQSLWASPFSYSHPQR
jgi:hypothetical protein